MDELSAPGVSALRQAQDTIIEHSLDRISSAHDFYRTLPEGSRDQIAAVARLGVTMFVDSAESPSTPLVPPPVSFHFLQKKKSITACDINKIIIS